jgi:hypothetical protein
MWLYVLTVVVGLFVLAYFNIRQKFSYFRSHGVTEDPGNTLARPAGRKAGRRAAWRSLQSGLESIS